MRYNTLPFSRVKTLSPIPKIALSQGTDLGEMCNVETMYLRIRSSLEGLVFCHVPGPQEQLLSGWWYTYPSQKTSVGMMTIPNMRGKIKNVPNHQPVRIVCQQNNSTLKTCIRWRLPLGNHAEQESSENHQQLQQSFTTFISYRGRLIMEFTHIPKLH